MTAIQNPEELFKQVSIRGRIAYGSVCLEQAFQENEIKNEWSSKILQLLWDFTTSDELDKWEEEISDFEPHYVNDENFTGYETLSKEQIQALKDFYKSLPYFIILLIENTIEIGTSNLYGGTGEFSSSSLEPTLKIHKTMESFLSKKPRLEAFLAFKYNEFHGWGNSINKEDVLKNVW